MRRRFILKYDHHHDGGSGRYGVYDTYQRQIHWCENEAQARSDAARLNAVGDLDASLNNAVTAITILLTGPLATGRRTEYKRQRATLRGLRAGLPGVGVLAAELQDEQLSAPAPAGAGEDGGR